MIGGTKVTAKRPLVAVVDDDPAVCSSLKFALELEDFAVRIFGTAAEVLQAGNLDAYDCFVVDQRMPKMNGMELIGTLRRQQVGAPAILIISHPSDALNARAAEASVSIVEKPLLSNALVERIREACGRV